jgi:hypothetical protein
MCTEALVMAALVQRLSLCSLYYASAQAYNVRLSHTISNDSAALVKCSSGKLVRYCCLRAKHCFGTDSQSSGPRGLLC